MKRSLILAGTAIVAIAGCSSNPRTHNEFPSTLDHDVCRSYPGDVVNGYEFLYRVTTLDGSVTYSGRQMSMTREQGGSGAHFSNMSQEPYSKTLEVSTKNDHIVNSRLVIDKIDVGLDLKIGYMQNPENEGFNYTLNQSELVEFRRLGEDADYIESPVIQSHHVAGSSPFNRKVDVRYGEVKKSAVDQLFGNDKIDPKDRPFRLEVVACPVTGNSAGSVEIEN